MVFSPVPCGSGKLLGCSGLWLQIRLYEELLLILHLMCIYSNCAELTITFVFLDLTEFEPHPRTSWSSEKQQRQPQNPSLLKWIELVFCLLPHKASEFLVFISAMSPFTSSAHCRQSGPAYWIREHIGDKHSMGFFTLKYVGLSFGPLLPTVICQGAREKGGGEHYFGTISEQWHKSKDKKKDKQGIWIIHRLDN